MDIVNDIVWHSFVLFLWIGSALAILVGIGIWLAPDKTGRINQYFSRWIDTYRLQAALDRPRWTERFMYRHHRLIGGLMLGGALFVLYKFLLTPLKGKISSLTGTDVFGLIDATAAVLTIGAVLGAALGLVMITRPSLLRDLEKASNHWVSTQGFDHIVNRRPVDVDKYAFRYNRVTGLFLILSGLYVFVILTNLLLRGDWRF
jgi:hypothetical protein